MRLEAITAAVRPRGNWEAMDLGLLLTRRHWGTVMAAWLAVFAPIAGVLFVLLAEDPQWVPVILWWLKPAWDRLVLHVLSRALFAAAPSWGEAVRAWPGVLRHSGILWALTLGRFDPGRSFTLPVRQLEGLERRRRRRRVQVLRQHTGGSAGWLTVAGIHVEGILVLGSLLFVLLLSPLQLGMDLAELGLGDGTAALEWLLALAAAAAICLVEPFYVGAGFALYLNRRAHLEGWDLELAFRRLQQRLAAPAAGRAAAVLLLVAVGIAGTAQPLHAEPMPKQQARALAEEVLQAPEFDTRQEVETWRYTGPKHDYEPEAAEPDAPGASPLLGVGLAPVLELLLWGAAAALLLWLLLNHRRWTGYFRGGSPAVPAEPPTEVLCGLDIAPQRLPEDIPGRARELLRQNDPRAALSLLYRGALGFLVNRSGLDLPSGATEGDCLRAVRRSRPAPQSRYFGELTRAWQRTAYADRPPALPELDALCRDWGGHFGEAP